MSSRAPLAVSAAALLALASVAGCSSSTTTPEASVSASATTSNATEPNGIAEKSAEQILKASRAAAEKASSVHVVIEQENAGTAVRTDITLSDQGSTGTLGQPDGQTADVVGTPDAVYIKGSSFAQQLGPDVAAQVEGKWIKIPKDNPVAQSFAGLSSVQEFISTVLATPEKLKKLPVKDIDGVPAVGLDSQQGSLWISTVGEPYPVEIMAPEGQNGKMTLTEWNAPVTITPPPESDVVDISTLQSTQGGAPAPSPGG